MLPSRIFYYLPVPEDRDAKLVPTILVSVEYVLFTKMQSVARVTMSSRDVVDTRGTNSIHTNA